MLCRELAAMYPGPVALSVHRSTCLIQFAGAGAMFTPRGFPEEDQSTSSGAAGMPAFNAAGAMVGGNCLLSSVY